MQEKRTRKKVNGISLSFLNFVKMSFDIVNRLEKIYQASMDLEIIIKKLYLHGQN